MFAYSDSEVGFYSDQSMNWPTSSEPRYLFTSLQITCCFLRCSSSQLVFMIHCKVVRSEVIALRGGPPVSPDDQRIAFSISSWGHSRSVMRIINKTLIRSRCLFGTVIVLIVKCPLVFLFSFLDILDSFLRILIALYINLLISLI